MRKHNKLLSVCVMSALTGLLLISVSPTQEVDGVVPNQEFVEMASVKDIELPTTEEIEIERTQLNIVESTSEEVTTEQASTESQQITTVNYTGGYSEYDIWLMQCCVETETHGADFDSKTHVASVILNRVHSERFSGNTPAAVITAPSQFAYFRTEITQDTIDAVNYVLENGDTTQGGLFFHSGAYTDTFSGAEYIFTDTCGHHIYR